MGVYEIRQNDSAILLYVKEIKSPAVADLLIALNGKAMLSAGTKPYLSVKCGKEADPVGVLKKIFKI